MARWDVPRPNAAPGSRHESVGHFIQEDAPGVELALIEQFVRMT